MEPIEASNLDNQYKYYWEGDLCGQAGQEDGAVLEACPACGGGAASSRQSGQGAQDGLRTCSLLLRAPSS